MTATSLDGTSSSASHGNGSAAATKPFASPPRGVGDLESAVLGRYADASRAAEPALCCPTINYDKALLAMLPQEIIEKDYGCGDPSKYVGEGEAVVDLGSGGGKVCYMISKKVGPREAVVGVDFNDPMLALARKYQGEMAGSLASITLAASLAKQFTGNGLVHVEVASSSALLVSVGAAGAATAVLATILGMPSSTTHAPTSLAANGQ